MNNALMRLSRYLLLGTCLVAGQACGPEKTRADVESELRSEGPTELPVFEQLNVPSAETLVGGRVELTYHGSDGLPGAFYMALMVMPENSAGIEDFFGDEPASEDCSDLSCPFIRKDIPLLRRDVVGSIEGPDAFAIDFPGHLDREFKLTFRRFDGEKYWLWNVPKGRAYVWFHTAFDGSRVTQLPIRVDFNPVRGTALRIDLLDVNFMRTFTMI